MKYKIAMCQFRPVLLNVDANIDKMKQMIEPIDADLIVFPELATSGYVFNSQEEVIRCAEVFNQGITAQTFKEIAERKQCSIVIGFPENDNGEFYNSSIMINPNGCIYLYRKIHLFNEEKRWFKDGNLGFNVYPAKNQVRVGMMICFDWFFPESARTLMLKGAQIIAHPSNLVMPWCQQAMTTRCLENHVFGMTANRVGTEKNGDKSLSFTGKSQITSPLGEIICRYGEEEEQIKVVEIETKEADNKQVNHWNHILRDRKEKYYLP